jgi:hypothetical protein
MNEPLPVTKTGLLGEGLIREVTEELKGKECNDDKARANQTSFLGNTQNEATKIEMGVL